jgi:hypothetical protein
MKVLNCGYKITSSKILFLFSFHFHGRVSQKKKHPKK